MRRKEVDDPDPEEATEVPVKKRCRDNSANRSASDERPGEQSVEVLSEAHTWKPEDILQYFGVSEDQCEGTKLEDEIRLLEGMSEERQNWFTNAPLLYGCFISLHMEWPALSVAWLSDVSGESCKLVVGTQTDGTTPAEVAVLEMHCQLEERQDGEAVDPWQEYELPDLGEAHCLGIQPLQGRPLLRHVARWQHPTEVNRIAPCPYQQQLLATKTADGDVLLYDYKACAQHPQQRCRSKSSSWWVKTDTMSPQTVFSFPAKVDGWALAWGPQHRGLLASAANNGQVCAWDARSANMRGGACEPLSSCIAHEGACGDISFSSHCQGETLATVGDDGYLKIWDSRAFQAPHLSKKVSDGEAQSVDWSRHQEHIVAIAGKPKDVLVWDLRALGSPLRTLIGHTEEAVIVRWAATREDLLCSGSKDKTVILWDLQADRDQVQPDDAQQDEDGDDVSKELLFIHSGHTGGISDVAWNSQDHFLLGSVAEDNRLQIWQPSSTVTE